MREEEARKNHGSGADSETKGRGRNRAFPALNVGRRGAPGTSALLTREFQRVN